MQEKVVSQHRSYFHDAAKYVAVVVLAACTTVNIPPTQTSSVQTGALTAPRYQHTSTLLLNGKVLVTGGADAQNRSITSIASAELYDSHTEKWSTTHSMVTARDHHTATLLPNGKVLVTGGFNFGSEKEISNSELYDPDNEAWSATGSLITARVGQTATLLQNGKVLVAGGHHGKSDALETAELYDPKTGVWSETGSMSTVRSGHAATLLKNGKVLVSGGMDATLLILNSAELYDPDTGMWEDTGSFREARFQHKAVPLNNGNVLTCGGEGTKKSSTFDRTVFGKSEYTIGAIASCELYDYQTGKWLAVEGLTKAREGHTATLLPNGKVLVSGGTNGGGLAWTTFSLLGHYYLGEVVSERELYDPNSGRWTNVDPLLIPRGFHTATLLPNGRVLFIGGVNADGFPLEAELYENGAK